MTSLLLVKREKESLKIMVNISFQRIKVTRFFKEIMTLFLKAKLFLDNNKYMFFLFRIISRKSMNKNLMK